MGLACQRPGLSTDNIETTVGAKRQVEKDRSASALPSVHCAHASPALDLGALHSRRRPMREPGAVLLVAWYELGHQRLTLAWPAAFLERRGYAPAVMDLAVEPFDAEKVRRARVVAVSVPMHTALRLGVRVAERVREINPGCHLAFYGLYATLNADYLKSHGVDSVLAGQVEQARVDLVDALQAADPACACEPGSHLARQGGAAG